jgi:osmoprotectant transport system permease protein
MKSYPDTGHQLVTEIITQTIEKSEKLKIKREIVPDQNRIILSEIVDGKVPAAWAFEDEIQSEPALSKKTLLTEPLGFNKNKQKAYAIMNKKFAENHPGAWREVKNLENQFTNAVLDHLTNDVVLTSKHSISEGAQIFLGSLQWRKLNEKSPPLFQQSNTFKLLNNFMIPDKFLRLTKEHLILSFLPLLFAILIGIPTGLVIRNVPVLIHVFDALGDILQTLPFMVFLCLLVPSHGFSVSTVVVGGYLFHTITLIKVISKRNTYLETDSQEIWRIFLQSFQVFWNRKIYSFWIPLIPDIKKLAILSIHFALIGGFFGAGGYGSLIALGLSLRDVITVLNGSIPVAVMCFIVKWLFELLEWKIKTEKS